MNTIMNLYQGRNGAVYLSSKNGTLIKLDCKTAEKFNLNKIEDFCINKFNKNYKPEMYAANEAEKKIDDTRLKLMKVLKGVKGVNFNNLTFHEIVSELTHPYINVSQDQYQELKERLLPVYDLLIDENKKLYTIGGYDNNKLGIMPIKNNSTFYSSCQI